MLEDIEGALAVAANPLIYLTYFLIELLIKQAIIVEKTR